MKLIGPFPVKKTVNIITFLFHVVSKKKRNINSKRHVWEKSPKGEDTAFRLEFDLKVQWLILPVINQKAKMLPIEFMFSQQIGMEHDESVQG